MHWVKRLLNRKRMERDLEKELRYHLEHHRADLIAQGMEPEEARRHAALAFGGAEQIKESCRDVRHTRWLEDLVRDGRHGLRVLRASPLFSVAAVLSLALGIGANTAIFSLMDLVMLRTMPVREPERLLQFQKLHPTYGRGNFSTPLFEQMQSELKSFEGLLAISQQGAKEIRIGGQTEEANVELVSNSYHSVLGVSAAVGRVLQPDDREVAVISNGYWKRRFGGDVSAIGKTFQLNKTVFTIVGVMPSEFFGVMKGKAPEISIPLIMDGEVRGAASLRTRSTVGWLSVMGRLRAGYSVEQARAEVRTYYGRIIAADVAKHQREIEKQTALQQRMELIPAAAGFDELRQRFSEPLKVLMGVVALVLLIACANIANLLLSRSASRQREIAVRLAIGAGRSRIIRQLVTEGMLLSVAGGALGVLLAWWLSNALVTMMSNGGPRIALNVQPDLRILAFAITVSVLACLLFSLAPAIQSTRRSFQPVLAEIRATRWRLGKGLIIAQVAIALVLLVGAGLFGRTLLNMYQLDAGFNREGVVLFSINSAKAGYTRATHRDLISRVITELKTLPGVKSASVALLLPLSGGGWDGQVKVEGYTHRSDEDDHAHLNAVGPDYFRTIGTPLLLGREFYEGDRVGVPRVAVVNDTFARYYFNGQSAIGKWVSLGDPNKDRAVIVGVVKDVKYRTLRQPFPRTVFFSAWNDGPDWQTFLVRTDSGAEEMARAAGAALARINPNLRALEVRTLSEHVSRTILTERMLATLAGFFGVLAMLLAAIGIYGVIAFQMSRRKREIGIRVALGARPGEVCGMVVGQSAKLVIAGCAIGLAGAMFVTRVAEKMLFGVKPTDPFTFVIAVLALAGVAIAASYLPGRAAARLNPVETLRCD